MTTAPPQLAWEKLAKNCRARVSENLGNGTFRYEGAQGADNPEMTVWRFSVFGGLAISGDPDAPGEISSSIGAMIASHPRWPG